MKYLLIFGLWAASLGAIEQTVYIGTYTGANSTSQGIYRLRFDTATGGMSAPELAAESASPSFLAIAKGARFLYAVNEAGGGEVSAFAIEPGGNLRLLNRVASRGNSPCHLNLDRSGKWLAVANYGSGTAAIFPVGPDGKLGEAAHVVQHKGSSVDRGRQAGPHAHSVNFSRDGKHLFIADLGLDEVKIYSFDKKTGAIAEIAKLEAPKGGGPRHVALGKNGLAYAVHEMGSSVTSYRWTGGATGQQIATAKALPADFTGRSSGAEVLLDRNQKLVYSSNRGHDSITVYETDPVSGSLKTVAAVPLGGRTPRGFVLSPDGKYLLAAAQDSNQIFAFRIDKKRKTLEKIGEPVTVGKPVCLRFVGK